MTQIAGKPFTQLTNLNITGELRVNGSQSGPFAEATNGITGTVSDAITNSDTLVSTLIPDTSVAVTEGFTAVNSGFQFTPTGTNKKGLFYARVRVFLKASAAGQSFVFDVGKLSGTTVTRANTIGFGITVGTSNVLVDITGTIELEEGDIIGLTAKIDSGSPTITVNDGDFDVGELSAIGA